MMQKKWQAVCLTCLSPMKRYDCFTDSFSPCGLQSARYSALDWDQACRLREQYYSMASVDALLIPNTGSDISPFLSVVVPVYNVSKYLEECLDSVLQQSFKDFEVLLVNDGSTDGSLDLLEKRSHLVTRVSVS